jgi:hypothetical protein
MKAGVGYDCFSSHKYPDATAVAVWLLLNVVVDTCPIFEFLDNLGDVLPQREMSGGGKYPRVHQGGIVRGGECPGEKCPTIGMYLILELQTTIGRRLGFVSGGMIMASE